jgi:SAM-dependent methyltransferase
MTGGRFAGGSPHGQVERTSEMRDGCLADEVRAAPPRDPSEIRASANLWDERAEAYRTSERHATGRDLDLVVEWCEPGPSVTVLDVATGGGHVARRLREHGCSVVTSDISPGMHPDLICGAEDLPFADSSFDVVVSRLAAHHFDDVRAAVREMARVTRRLVVIQDLRYEGAEVEKAERLRDPSHVRSYSVEEWLGLLGGAGLEVEAVELLAKRGPLETWLALTGCEGAEAVHVRELVADRIEGVDLRTEHVILKAGKAA